MACCFPCISHGLWTTDGPCTYLHVSIRHSVDTVCNAAVSLEALKPFGNCSTLVFGVSNEFRSVFADFSGFCGSRCDMFALFGRGVGVFEVRHGWSHAFANVLPGQQHSSFSPKISELKSNNSQLRVCLKIPFLFGRFGDPICGFRRNHRALNDVHSENRKCCLGTN